MTRLFAAEDGPRWLYPQEVLVRVLSAIGVSAVATISIGTAAGGYTDIMPATKLTGLNAAHWFVTLPIVDAIGALAPRTEVFCKVKKGATAAACTAMVMVRGLYS